MHDSVAGERVDTPSVSIITEEFVSAARLMATVLGASDLPHVTVPHPISSATPERLDEIARIATIESVRILTQA